MRDYILRITAGDGNVRAFIATTRDTVQEAGHIHRTTPVVSAALGRLLTASAIIGTMLKNDGDILTLNIKGDGPLGGLVVSADNNARVKGYPFNSQVDLPLNALGKLDVSRAIGAGHLHVIKDMGLKEPYTGVVPLVSGEIGEDLAYYFTTSEQTPSAVGLGVLVDTDYTIRQAGGFVIQMMPQAPEDIIVKLEERIDSLGSITGFLDKGQTPEDMAEFLFGSMGYTVNETIPVEYYCNCSRERVEKALISIGKEELEKILEQDKKATLHCHFCNKNYDFDEERLREILYCATDIGIDDGEPLK